MFEIWIATWCIAAQWCNDPTFLRQEFRFTRNEMVSYMTDKNPEVYLYWLTCYSGKKKSTEKIGQKTIRSFSKE